MKLRKNKRVVMPTIEVSIRDIESLLKETLDQERLETLLEKVKGEVKDFFPETDSVKIELNDTNRPDLWSPEGIARQILPGSQPWSERYPFFDSSTPATQKIEVSKEVSAVRPYIAACISRGLYITEAILEQLIQSQEKLADSFGRRRQTVSIGLYRLQKIQFPVSYDLVDPEACSFVPLGFDEEMSLKQIITEHPKGIEYAATLTGAKRFPILRDAQGEVLSFPPIINSRALGEVAVGDSELFVEVTGTDLRMVTLAINIFAANLSDRGSAIEPVKLEYPEETAFGTNFQTPYDLSQPVALKLSELNRVLGESVQVKEAVSVFESYGLSVEVEGTESEEMKITSGPYRDDLMHSIDLVEDFAISRGYDSFSPAIPSTYTVGSLSRIEVFSDAMRTAMVGFGFEEVVSNILGSSEDFIEKMGLAADQTEHAETDIVEISNPMTERFSLLRSWLLPALLRVEGHSSKAYYPHRLFEVGEVARMAPNTAEQTETLIHLGALIAHPGANFSELHAVLEALFHRLTLPVRLEPVTHPSFIEGRSGVIKVNNTEVGQIGELAPAVLEAWQIGMPTVAFEVDLNCLYAI